MKNIIQIRTISRPIGFLQSMGLAVSIFLGSAVIGAILRLHIHVSAPPIDKPYTLTAMDVFVVNSRILLVLVLGGFVLAIPTVLSLMLNGIGFGSIVIAILDGGSLRSVVLTLGPHGLFELPAVWLAGGVGIHISHRVLAYCVGRTDSPIDRQYGQLWLGMVLVAIGLAGIGAVIEITITPWIASKIL